MRERQVPYPLRPPARNTKAIPALNETLDLIDRIVKAEKKSFPLREVDRTGVLTLAVSDLAKKLGVK